MNILYSVAEICGAIAAISAMALGIISSIRFVSGLIDRLTATEENILDIRKNLRNKQAQIVALQKKSDERMDGFERRLYHLFGRSKFTVPPKD